MPSYFRGLNLMLLLFTVYGIVSIISGRIIVKADYSKVSNFYYLKDIYISLLPIYSAYLYTIQGRLTQSGLRKWIVIWLLVASAQFYSYERAAIENSLYDIEEITNNVGYIFLAIIPALVVYDKKPLIQFSCLLYCLAFIILAMKRGAILMSVVLFVFFLFRIYKISSRKTKKYVIFFSIISLCGVIFLIMNMIETSEYFVRRIEQTVEGDSSMRDVLYRTLWNHFMSERNFKEVIFGHGANATILVAGNYAHNDWLEILINNGIFGVFVYTYYWLGFIKTMLFSRRDLVMYTGITMILMVSFMKSFISMSYSSLDIYMTISLGFFMARSCGNNNK